MLLTRLGRNLRGHSECLPEVSHNSLVKPMTLIRRPIKNKALPRSNIPPKNMAGYGGLAKDMHTSKSPEDLHGIVFLTEEILLGYAAIFKHQLSGRVRAKAELILLGAEGKTRGILFNDKG